MDLSERPDFGQYTLPDGTLNHQRERNAIRYLLQILDVRERGEFILGGPGMDTLEGSAYRVAQLVDQLKGQAIAIGFSDEEISRAANAIRETTSDEMIKHVGALSDLELVTLAAKQDAFTEQLITLMVIKFPRRIHQLSPEK